jgi:hypothetical protein
MKKLFITAAIATLFSVAAFADNGKQNGDEENVSYNALSDFKSDFKDADNTVWSITESFQKVHFTERNKIYTAFYNLDGDYLGLTENVNYNRIALPARKEIADEYKDYKVMDVIKYNTNTTKEPTAYFVDLQKNNREILLKVSADNEVSYFKDIN